VHGFEFLTRHCISQPGHNSVTLGNANSGFCVKCPDLYPSLAAAQAAANTDALTNVAQAPNVRNIGKIYCGADPYIQKWSSYYQCYGGERGIHHGFINPFHYSRCGTGNECFISGRSVANFQAAHPVAPQGGRRQPAVAAIIPPPAPQIVPPQGGPALRPRGRPPVVVLSSDDENDPFVRLRHQREQKQERDEKALEEQLDVNNEPAGQNDFQNDIYRNRLRPRRGANIVERIGARNLRGSAESHKQRRRSAK
jgi:hypothetical protein